MRFVLLFTLILSGSYSLAAPPLICQVQLHHKVLSWLELRIEKTFASFTDLPGMTLKLNSQSYQVIARLGEGGEGTVYLVTRDQKLYVIKVFRTAAHFANAASILEYKDFLPAVLEVDSESRMFLTEYREGVPVDFLIESGSAIGLSEEESQTFNRNWMQWARDLQNQAYRQGIKKADFYYEMNAIYSFRHDQFFLIDAK